MLPDPDQDPLRTAKAPAARGAGSPLSRPTAIATPKTPSPDAFPASMAASRPFARAQSYRDSLQDRECTADCAAVARQPRHARREIAQDRKLTRLAASTAIEPDALTPPASTSAPAAANGQERCASGSRTHRAGRGA